MNKVWWFKGITHLKEEEKTSLGLRISLIVFRVLVWDLHTRMFCPLCLHVPGIWFLCQNTLGWKLFSVWREVLVFCILPGSLPHSVGIRDVSSGSCRWHECTSYTYAKLSSIDLWFAENFLFRALRCSSVSSTCTVSVCCESEPYVFWNVISS